MIRIGCQNADFQAAAHYPVNTVKVVRRHIDRLNRDYKAIASPLRKDTAGVLTGPARRNSSNSCWTM